MPVRLRHARRRIALSRRHSSPDLLGRTRRLSAPASKDHGLWGKRPRSLGQKTTVSGAKDHGLSTNRPWSFDILLGTGAWAACRLLRCYPSAWSSAAGENLIDRRGIWRPVTERMARRSNETSRSGAVGRILETRWTGFPPLAPTWFSIQSMNWNPGRARCIGGGGVCTGIFLSFLSARNALMPRRMSFSQCKCHSLSLRRTSIARANANTPGAFTWAIHTQSTMEQRTLSG